MQHSEKTFFYEEGKSLPRMLPHINVGSQRLHNIINAFLVIYNMPECVIHLEWPKETQLVMVSTYDTTQKEGSTAHDIDCF